MTHPRLEDLTGRRFGMLVVLRYHGQARGRTWWLCRCDCGTERVAIAPQLKAGVTWRCNGHRLPDLIGRRFDRLVVIARAEPDTIGRVRWLCACDCGETVPIVGRYLTCKKVRSCGCLRREAARTWATRRRELVLEAA